MKNPNDTLLYNVKVPTIGIVGVTVPGAVDCVQKIHKAANSKFEHHHHPNIILHQLNFGPTHHAQNQGKWDTVENRLLESIESLTKSGADFIIIPANTVHKVIDNVKSRSPIPVLSILDIVANECRNNKLRKVGVLGTRWTMTEHLYKKPLKQFDIEEIIPSMKDQHVVQKAIFEELIPYGNVNVKTFTELLSIVDKLKLKGCDGIILGCTELPLVLNKENCGIPTLDSTAILAEAAIVHCITLMQKSHTNVSNPALKYQISKL